MEQRTVGIRNNNYNLLEFVMKSGMMPCIVLPKPHRASMQSLSTGNSPGAQNMELSKASALGHSQKQANHAPLQNQPFRQPLLLKQQQVQELSQLLSSLTQDVITLNTRLQDIEMRMAGLESRDTEGEQTKKKARRRACDIQKNFKCYFHGCAKAYGSEISLNLHIKLKHKPKTALQESAGSDKPAEDSSLSVEDQNCSEEKNHSFR